MLIERHLPHYDVASRHQTRIHASPEQVHGALRRMDFAGSWVIRGLLLLRGVPALFTRRGAIPSFDFTLEGFLRSGFVLLEEQPPAGLVLGLVGQFWRPSGGLVRIDPEGFAGFERPGFARAAWSFELFPLEGGEVRLVTETRVLCSDPASRRRFGRYWRLVGPFSGLMRRSMLRRIRRAAEATGGSSAAKQNAAQRV